MTREHGVVLLVDDDHDSRIILEQLLRWIGYDVIALADPRECVALVSTRTTLTAILLDLDMPHRSGWELLTDLRACAECTVVPILAVTGWLEWADEASSAGFDGVVVKPATVAALRRELERVTTSR